MGARHPLGVLPCGNMYAAGAAPSVRHSSLGAHLSRLPDALVVRVLSFADAPALLALAQCSRACYAFARDEDLWRALTLRAFGARFRFARSWRRTYALAARSARPAPAPAPPAGAPPVFVQVAGVYSDVLFHKWRCAAASVRDEWLAVDNVRRADAADLSGEQFRAQFEAPGVPVVLTGVVSAWPASAKWNREYLARACGAEQTFVAGGFRFGMEHYLDYSDRIEGRCDQPLYLFDSDFARKAPALADDYTVPEYFSEDLFQHLGEDNRPHYRWLIVGPKNSGSSFHKDPNATSAWNACVRGSKRWLLFPPDSPPPGIHPTADESDVTAPVSVLEWYINFYEAARESGARLGAVECTVRAGEIIFVPSGWWHAVINLEWSAAITQNYVSSTNFVKVASWLAERPEQVSGCRDESHARCVASSFVSTVLRARPELHSIFQPVGKAGKRPRDDSSSPQNSKTPKPKRGLWDSLRVESGDSAEGAAAQFSFGIG